MMEDDRVYVAIGNEMHVISAVAENIFSVRGIHKIDKAFEIRLEVDMSDNRRSRPLIFNNLSDFYNEYPDAIIVKPIFLSLTGENVTDSVRKYIDTGYNSECLKDCKKQYPLNYNENTVDYSKYGRKRDQIEESEGDRFTRELMEMLEEESERYDVTEIKRTIDESNIGHISKVAKIFDGHIDKLEKMIASGELPNIVDKLPEEVKAFIKRNAGENTILGAYRFEGNVYIRVLQSPTDSHNN